MKPSYLLIAAGLTLASNALADTQDKYSYAGMRTACANLNNPNSTTDMFSQGKCLGMILSVVMSNTDVCEPNGWSAAQVYYITKAYAEKRPTMWHIPFPYMVRMSLLEAWPCASRPNNTPSVINPNAPARRS